MPVKRINHQRTVDFYRGNEEFVKRLLDLEDQVDRQQIPFVTPFLTVDQQEIVQQVISGRCLLDRWGGYAAAENCRILLAPLWWEHERDFEITLLKGQYADKYHQLSHRDVLGALMKLGIERNVFGDILVEDGVIYLFCTAAIACYLIQNLTQIGRAKITFTRCEDSIERNVKIEWRTEVISSMRFDTIVAAITHLSRRKAQELISKGLVKLNHVTLEETASLCNNDCTVSVRGYGRFIVHDTMRRTQKSNAVVEIGRYC